MREQGIFGRLGISGYFFRGRSSVELVRTCEALGLQGVDLWPWNYENAGLNEFAKQLRDAKLTVISHSVPGALFRLGESLTAEVYDSKIRPIVEASQQLDCTALQMYCATPTSGRPADGVTMLVDSLTSLLEMLPAEMTIFIENNLDQRGDDPNGANPSRLPDSLERVLSQLNSERIRICFDAANFLAVGEDPLVAFQRLKSHVGLVHVKDCEPFDVNKHVGRREASFLLRDRKIGEFLPTVVGSGALDWVTLHRVISEHFAQEQDHPWVVIDPFIHTDLLDWWCIQSVAAVRHLDAVVPV